jgi:hypothetical protein
MRTDQNSAIGPAPEAANNPPVAYAAPRLTVLGSLTELTAGGDAGGEPDGYGTAGSSGIIP